MTRRVGAGGNERRRHECEMSEAYRDGWDHRSSSGRREQRQAPPQPQCSQAVNNRIIRKDESAVPAVGRTAGAAGGPRGTAAAVCGGGGGGWGGLRQGERLAFREGTPMAMTMDSAVWVDR